MDITEDSLSALRGTLDSGDLGVRLAGLRALAAVGDEGSAERMRAVAADSDEDLLARRVAVRAIGTVRHRESIDFLGSLLRTGDQPPLRREAARALARFRHSAAAEALADALRGPNGADVQRLAAQALGLMWARDGDALADWIEFGDSDEDDLEDPEEGDDGDWMSLGPFPDRP
jgi:HEAT repeat protein